MSIFGSSSKTYYSSTSIKLFEDVPGIIKQTVGSSITQNRNIANDLITNLANGIFYKANALYNYGKGGLYPWGLPDGSISSISSSTTHTLKLIIEREVGQAIELHFTNLEVNPDNGHIIYTAEYYLVNTAGVLLPDLQVWTYDERTGVYPALTIDVNDVANVSPYYPIIPIRVNNQSYTEVGETYSSEVRKACRFLGLDAQDLSDSISQQGLTTEEVAAGATPDNPVEDAFVFLGVEITNDTKEGKKYIFDYFAHMTGISTVSKEDYLYWEAHNQEEVDENGDTIPVPAPPVNLVHLSDSNFSMELGWLYIDDNLITGSIGKVGTHTVEYTSSANRFFSLTNFFSRDTLHLRNQVSATQYIELNVVGVTHSIWAVGREIRTSLKSAFNDPDGVGQTFCIPLRKDLTKPLGAVRQHDLLHTAIRLVVSDKLKVKLKWYQTGIFQFIILVIAIVISIWFPPFGIAAFSAMAVGVAVLMVIAMKVLMPLVMKALADVVGEELALVVAVIAAFYVGGEGISAVVNAGLVAVKGVTSIVMGDLLQDELDALETLEEDTDKLLEEQSETQQQILQVEHMTKGDSYAIMATHDYVKKFNYSNKLPTLITATTEYYTDIMKFIDRPYSYIQLGNS